VIQIHPKKHLGILPAHAPTPNPAPCLVCHTNHRSIKVKNSKTAAAVNAIIIILVPIFSCWGMINKQQWQLPHPQRDI